MKREMPSFLFLIAIGLILFFTYAAFVIGMNVHDTIAVNRSVMSNLGDATLSFASDNRDVLTIAAIVLVAVGFLVRRPGHARS